jgi:hypothetical protein
VEVVKLRVSVVLFVGPPDWDGRQVDVALDVLPQDVDAVICPGQMIQTEMENGVITCVYSLLFPHAFGVVMFFVKGTTDVILETNLYVSSSDIEIEAYIRTMQCNIWINETLMHAH